MVSPVFGWLRATILSLAICGVFSGRAASASSLYTITNLGIDQSPADPYRQQYGVIGFDPSGKITYSNYERLQDGAYSIVNQIVRDVHGDPQGVLATVIVDGQTGYSLFPPRDSGDTNTQAFAVNNSGTAVGIAYYGSLGATKAIVFSPSGGVKLLPTLNGFDGSALSINDAGQIVGYSPNGKGSLAGFLSSGNTATDVNTLILPGSGFMVTRLSGINNQGQIVGDAIDSRGNTHYVLLTPVSTPEPGSVFIAVLTLIACKLLTKRMTRSSGCDRLRSTQLSARYAS